MADVIYKKGQSSNLNETRVPIVEGQILVTEDTAEMYIDMSDGKRKQITDTNKQDKFMTKEPLETFRSTFLTIDDRFDLYHKTYSSGISLDPGKGDFYGEGTSILSTASTNLTINNDNKAKFNYDDGSGKAQPVPVTGIATPKSDSPNDQAANKEYVDTAIANASIGGGGNVTIDLVGKKTEGNGEIFNDYESNKAYHNFTAAQGTQTSAGSMGYKIIDCDFNNLTITVNGDATALLDSKINETRDYFGLDNAISIQIKENYEFCCNVTDVYSDIIYSGTFKGGSNNISAETIYTVEDCVYFEFDNHYTIVLNNDDKGNARAFDFECDNLAIEKGMKVSCSVGFTGDLITTPGTLTVHNDTSVIKVDKLPSNIAKETVSNSSYLWTACTPEVGNVSIGTAAHAEGYYAKAVQVASHAQGNEPIAAGKYSTAEGIETIATYAAHSEGTKNHSLGHSSHTEGSNNRALGGNAHAEGNANKALFDNVHAEGNVNEAGVGLEYRYAGMMNNSSTNFQANTFYKYVDNKFVLLTELPTTKQNIKVFTKGTEWVGNSAHVEGRLNTATKDGAHAEGLKNYVVGAGSHVEGEGNIVLNNASHGEGQSNIIDALYGHVEGQGNIVTGAKGHAEGSSNRVTGSSAHGEGAENSASGNLSHVEGYYSSAQAQGSHAEGYACVTRGQYSHAQGFETNANGDYSFTGGLGTVAKENTQAQSVLGKYNLANDKALFIVGDGKNKSNRSNAFTVYDEGYAEVRTQGTSDNSVVINKTLMDAINSKFRYFSVNEDIPDNLPEGTFVFIYEE